MAPGHKNVSPAPFLMIGPGDGGGGYYDDYSSDYGWWDSSGGIDYGGSNSDSDGAAPRETLNK